MAILTLSDILYTLNNATIVRPPLEQLIAQLNAAGIITTGGGGSTIIPTINGGMPVGAVIPYGGTAAPTGWLLCYGQSLLRADYALLFTVIGTTYGAVDGTHFSMPDLRGRVVAGQDDMGGSSANRLTGSPTGGVDGDGLGNAGGAEGHTLTTAEIPAHTHDITEQLSTTALGGVGNRLTGASTGINSGSTGGGGAHNNVQPTLILNYIIFAGV